MSKNTKDEGKYVDLPGNVDNVVVRFPPEASGYLHIGHAKAALLNQHYQLIYKGKLIFRFDDTNPEKEKEDFEEVIREDLKLLAVKPDICSYTSDHFDLILEQCEKLLKQGLAYVDDTPAEQVKVEREARQESKNRGNSVEKNLQLWNEMKIGTELGKKCCVRAKIDMASNNGCMRDPAIFRCKEMAHPKTGNKYKVYPTYDFACPIVDSCEGVTHALRTTEYEDRDEQFAWFIKALGLRDVNIVSYARLNMMNTVLSKRKLTYFVEEGIVEGWDDPRMPTVRGIIRRGLTIDGLKQFIIAQGSSRSVVYMDWDKLWSFNRKILDANCTRLMAIEAANHVVLNLNCPDGTVQIPAHPKRTDLPMLNVSIGPKLLIEQFDAQQIKKGDKVTLMGWGNILVQDVNKGSNGQVISIDGQLSLEDKDFKKTLKISWLKADTSVVAKFIYYEHLILKPCLDKGDDFKDFINKESVKQVEFLVSDTFLREQKKGKAFQFLKRGYFIVDEEYDEKTIAHVGKPQPAVLISIPDGTTDLNIFPQDVIEWKKKIRDESLKLVQDISKGKSKKSTEVKNSVENNQAQQIDYGTIDASSELGRVVQGIQIIGNNIRLLKSANVDKKIIQENVKLLQIMKDSFKTLTGKEYVPPPQPVVEKKPQSNASAKDSGSNSGGAGEINQLINDIKSVGDKIRQLKADKADKKIVQENVQVLLDLKGKFKALTGQEYVPGAQPVVEQKPQSNNSGADNEVAQLNNDIKSVGDSIRQLKADKADKKVVQEKVKILLELKEKYKALTGKDYVPTPQPVVEQKPQPSAPVKEPGNNSGAENETQLNNEIKSVGDKIRQLKADKADKKVIQENVQVLLDLKAKFKALTGKEYVPGAQPAVEQKPQSNNPIKVAGDNSDKENEITQLNHGIKTVGDNIRQLKADKVDKKIIQENVQILLDLKAKYKEITGTEWVPQPANQTPQTKPNQSNQTSKPKQAKDAKKSPAKDTPKEEKAGVKKQTRLGIESKKDENLADWYTEVITKSEMIEYYDVSGCYILRPWAYAIWEMIQKFLDNGIKSLGVENVYFPMFVSQAALEKEKTHIEDFAPEVAWVTKSGQSDLAEPIAIRPTSETVMYPSFAKWCQSHRSLPIKVNQWCNIVRWEFKNPTPFLRTREFLWQEGHTVHADKEDAVKEVYQVLDLYTAVYEHLLAIPVIKGRKTEKEKFAGGDFTTTIEGYIPSNGRGIQAATSHHLGQNFSKMFEIIFEDPNEPGKKCYAYQNSWGLTTRTIGVMIMVHSDDKGLVLPPNIAPYQVVIVPCGITATTTDEEKTKLYEECNKLAASLTSAEIRCKCDLNDHYSPGWKFNHWELKGVPIRIELGPKDLSKKQFVAARRDTGNKVTYNLDSSVDSIKKLLTTIHDNLFNVAKKSRDDHLSVVYDWNDFLTKLDQKYFLIAPFCGEPVCEELIKKNSVKVDQSDSSGPLMGAKSLCIPFDQPKAIDDGMKCVNPHCKAKPSFFTLFGRSY
ncbi:bifunctional glutamate/proline--tRNA ligase [Tetranychus urticae]|uniref:bifunctional glutamate/proline--tRNA ligase n=1 Tax=Tetranychus urticae TaxID=32264 RepID=UPI00077BEE07|nr:bifunctional glutamate/proline--tRNA ligase [Tetranychus urticae]